MLTTPTGQAIYRKLAQAPSDWLRSADGRSLVARCLLLLRSCGERGRSDARYIRDSVRLYSVIV